MSMVSRETVSTKGQTTCNSGVARFTTGTFLILFSFILSPQLVPLTAAGTYLVPGVKNGTDGGDHGTRRCHRACMLWWLT